MKKIALLSALFCLMLSAATAQNIRFGLHASPTWSWLKTDDKFLENASANWGVKLGVIGEKYFTSNYAFFTGIGFAFNHGGTLQTGYANYRPWLDSDLTVSLDETDAKSLPQNSKLRYSLTYVEVPFGLKMRGGTNENSPIKFFAEAPVITLGFLTKAAGDIRGAGTAFDTQDEKIRDDVKGLGLSWGAGGGIEYELATHTTLVGGLYYQSQFSDVTSKGRARRTVNDQWIDEKAKTSMRAISLRIGVMF